MNDLRSHFDRVVVISLPNRKERRDRLCDNLQKASLIDPDKICWFDAVDGSREKIPAWAKVGPGAWGCRASHLRVLQAARRDGLERVLILEDDATFAPHAGEALADLMPLLPNAWELFFLGGQHVMEPRRTKHPAMMKGGCITRTHAYAVHARAFDLLIDEVGNDENYRLNPTMHLDHHLGYLQMEGLLKSYAPSWWIAGQEEGVSDISTMDDPQRWWHLKEYHFALPFVVASEELQESDHFYRPKTKAPERALAVFRWLRSVACEALLQGKLPLCQIDPSRLEEIWPAGTRVVSTSNELQLAADYAWTALKKNLNT